MSGAILEFLWTQSWQFAVLFVLVGLLCLLARRWSAHWRYLFCLVLLIKCVIPPLVPMSVPGVTKPLEGLLQRASVLRENSADVARTTGSVSQNFEPTASISEQPVVIEPGFWARPDWRILLTGIWMAGASAFLFVAVLKAARIQRGLKTSRTLPNLELECEYLELSEIIELKRRPKLCLIRGLSQPFVWGLWRGAIYLPENFQQQGTSRQRQLVMCHELAHVLRWDALVNAIQIVVQAVFFFHPLVWWLNRIIRHEREKCCDEMAIAILGAESREYGTAIVDRLANYFEPACPSSALAISGHAKDLEDRIKSVLRPNQIFSRRPTALAFATILVIGAIALPWQWVTVNASTVLPEKTDTAWSTVDLRGHINTGLEKTWVPDRVADNLSELAKGKHILGGITFDVRGVVRLAGSEQTQTRLPQEIKIAVDRFCSQIHLLHACSEAEKSGTEVAAIRVRYKDGSQTELPIRYGEQLRDWHFLEFEAVSNTNSVMAWTGSNPFMRAQNGAVRLYRTTFENPRPQVPIVGIDYISRRTKAAPFLVALTVN